MRKAGVAGAAVVLLLSSLACGSDDGIRTTLDEYSIELPGSTVPAGAQTFSVTNDGEIAHQFLVLRTNDAPDDLPVAKDGVVKLDAKGLREVAEIELLTQGQHEDLTTTLSPGRYVLICNIAGHYASGMRTGLEVT